MINIMMGEEFARSQSIGLLESIILKFSIDFFFLHRERRKIDI